jgi:Leucine-rich repeat (LRR) protein
MNINKLSNISELELNKNNLVRTIRNTECSTKIFGNCEVCKNEVVEVHHQVIKRDLGFNVDVGRNIFRLCYDHYGCIKCLQGVWDNCH